MWAEMAVAWAREGETETQICESFRCLLEVADECEGKENSRKPAAVKSWREGEGGRQTVALVGSDRFSSYGNLRWPGRRLFLLFSLTFAPICLN